jgi:hypothetical protein
VRRHLAAEVLYIRSESAKWAKVVKAAAIRID